MADLVAWAERFIATPSESRLGNAAIADVAAELLRELGLAADLESVHAGGGTHHAVLCEVTARASEGRPERARNGQSSDGPDLLLVTHLDTVPPGDSAAWTATGGDPFRPTRDGDRLYGLGSADAKVDFVCKAHALAAERGSLTRGVRLVGTFGEEIGMLGARWLVESGLTRGATRALVGEPSELAIVHAHKGYAVYEARVRLEALSEPGALRVSSELVRGAAAHSSAPVLGHNAVYAALELVEKSGALGVTALAGGGAVNVVPDRCEITLVHGGGRVGEGVEIDAPIWSAKPLVRFLAAWRELEAGLGARSDPRFSPAQSVASLGRVALEEGCAVFAFDVRPIPGDGAAALVAPLARTAELRCVRTNPALATPSDSELVRALQAAQRAAGLPARVETKATCTEAGILAAAGLEAVVLGPGTSVGNVHKPNEHTRVSQLHQAVTLYRAALARLAGPGGA
ncbi:MAG TPA: M20/M25/M40 family metallo-hydrolase [Myxococcota bacterium]|nr:M20/M25/M40 family metallo-hydrolase [Myxococcota bacterium]